MTKKERIGYYIMLTITTLAFLAVGTLKIIGLPMEVELFTKWGYPLWFMYFIGACEVLGAIGLHIKRVARVAGICLVVLLIGAIGTHIFHNEGLVAPIPATVLMLFLFGILYLNAKKDGAPPA